MDKLIILLEDYKYEYTIGVYANNYFFKKSAIFTKTNAIMVKIKFKHTEIFLNRISSIEKSIITKNNYYQLYKLKDDQYLIISFIIKSHIQIPNSILNNFRDKEKLYYISTEDRILRASAASLYNTTIGYYSLQFEDHMCSQYETPLGKINKKLIDFALGNSKDLVLENIYYDLEKLFKMSCFRNPNFISKINKNSITNKIVGDFNAEQVAYLMENKEFNFMKNMNAFIIVNKTNNGFVTTKSMFSSITIKQYDGIIFSLHPNVSILIIPKEYYKEMIRKYGEHSYIKIEDDEIINKINYAIYNNALRENGDVIGKKQDLENLMNYLGK